MCLCQSNGPSDNALGQAAPTLSSQEALQMMHSLWGLVFIRNLSLHKKHLKTLQRRMSLPIKQARLTNMGYFMPAREKHVVWRLWRPHHRISRFLQAHSNLLFYSTYSCLSVLSYPNYWCALGYPFQCCVFFTAVCHSSILLFFLHATRLQHLPVITVEFRRHLNIVIRGLHCGAVKHK